MTESDNSDKGTTSRPGSRGKAQSLIEEYNLSDIGDELVKYWKADKDDRMSLRKLTDYFNKVLLREALRQNADSTLDGEADNYYRLLTDDDVSSGTHIQAKNQLDQKGINVEQLQENFVSRQAIHTYLTKDRGVDYDKQGYSDQERLDARIETIGRLKSRLVTVVERTISEFSQFDWLSTGDVRVMVLVQVQCSSCDAQYPITEFLTNGGCDC